MAMLRAAEGGVGTVRDLAMRAQVGLGAAKYTASRLVSAGQLVEVEPGRPAVLGLPCAASGSGKGGAASGAGLSIDERLDAMEAAVRSFWQRPGCSSN